MLWRMLIGAMLSVTIFQRCFSVRFLNLYYTMLYFNVTRINHKKRMNEKKINRLMRKEYFLINLAIITENQVIAYKMADLLKLSFGENIIRNNEPKNLMALIIKAVKKEQYEIAEYLLDAYKTLLSNVEDNCCRQCFKQLLILLSVMQKKNLLYLTAKVTDCIFYSLMKFDLRESQVTLIAIIAIKRIGIIAAKKKDIALFNESKRILIVVSLRCNKEVMTAKLENLLIDWLYYILKVDNKDLLESYSGFFDTLNEEKLFTEAMIDKIITEIPNISGMAIMNLSSQSGIEVMKLLLKLPEYHCSDFQGAVKSTLKLLQMAVATYGFDKSFVLFTPLLELGRKLFVHEQRFIYSSDRRKKENLTFIIKELLFFFEVEARQSGTSIENIILVMRQYWIVFSKLKNSAWSVEGFCNELLEFWKVKRNFKKNKLTISHNEMLNFPLLVAKDKERLDLVL